MDEYLDERVKTEADENSLKSCPLEPPFKGGEKEKRDEEYTQRQRNRETKKNKKQIQNKTEEKD